MEAREKHALRYRRPALRQAGQDAEYGARVWLNEKYMRAEEKRLARERLTMTKMVGIYCAAHHDGSGKDLCATCREFLDYAELRLRKCPYGEEKPTCANCPIHCYKPARRAQVSEIMRYAGPRMMLRHPILAVAHQLDGFRKAKHPRKLTREQRLNSRK